MRFEFDGEKYPKASSHQKEWGTRIIEELQLHGDERILDLGCGDGVLTAELARRVPNGYVLGIDASQGMIDTSFRHRQGNLEFRLMDINAIAFENEFDVIYSNACLHWIKDHTPLLQNVYKALRTNGRIRFNFGGKGNCLHFIKVIRETMNDERFSRYFQNFVWPWFMPDAKEYRSTVGHVPFREVRVWEENADRYFPNRETIEGWIDQPSLVPILPFVAEEDRPLFRQCVINRMLNETLQDNGTFFETFRRINVFARK